MSKPEGQVCPQNAGALETTPSGREVVLECRPPAVGQLVLCAAQYGVPLRLLACMQLGGRRDRFGQLAKLADGEVDAPDVAVDKVRVEVVEGLSGPQRPATQQRGVRLKPARVDLLRVGSPFSLRVGPASLPRVEHSGDAELISL